MGRRAPTTTGTGDQYWAFFKDVVVAAVRYNKIGTKITSGYTAANALMYADQVVVRPAGPEPEPVRRRQRGGGHQQRSGSTRWPTTTAPPPPPSSTT